MRGKFPEAKTLIEHLSHSEYARIIDEGIEEPYTLKSLYEVPSRYTYQGLGKKFEQKVKKLRKEGKKLTFLELLLFFKKENTLINLSCILFYTTEFFLPLLMEKFLRWIGASGCVKNEGVKLLTLLFFLSVFRLLFILQNLYFVSVITVSCKNALGVREDHFE